MAKIALVCYEIVYCFSLYVVKLFIHICKLLADVRVQLYWCFVIQTYAPDSQALGQTRSHGLDLGLVVMSHFAIKAVR